MSDDEEKGTCWRFPGNNFSGENGIATLQSSPFGGNPIGTLAREICQNSIDARLSPDKPVIVDFSEFEIPKNELPGRDRLEQEIINCQNMPESQENFAETLNSMLEKIRSDRITCLRISDHNTTGLLDVQNFDAGSFHYMTKGNGLSSKLTSGGGSKGVGKNSLFVNSEISTVFFSTYNKSGEKAYTGVCQLCSAIKDQVTKEKTIGTGWYSSDSHQDPIIGEELDFASDTSFKKRANGDTGTDLYIIGFKNDKAWDKSIVTQILESFMYAIYQGVLIAYVNGTEISREKLSGLVSDEKNLYPAKHQKTILAQFELLHDPNVIKKTIAIPNYGDFDLYIKVYGESESNNATNVCSMIRYPFMKISSIQCSKIGAVSAMAVIPNNKLCSELRKTENATHSKWDSTRIKSEERYIYEELIDTLNSTIKAEIMNSIVKVGETEAELEHSGDYISDDDVSDSNGNENNTPDSEEEVTTTKIKENKTVESVGDKQDDDATSLIPDIGEETEDNNDTAVHTGENNGKGDTHSGDTTGGSTDGDNEIFKYKPLSGIKYNVISTNRTEGEFKIIFTPNSNQTNLEVRFYAIDDSGGSEPVEIVEASINNVQLKVDNKEKITIPSVGIGQRTIITVKTSERNYISSEVKFYGIN
jgi:hypothetical protein